VSGLHEPDVDEKHRKPQKAALWAGAFLAVVLVAAFTMGEILLMRGQFSNHSMDEVIAIHD
jgi:hypothetical protein